ncbi:KRAB-A domain-containing protein 2-like [Myzus persicae]|uniref:KRAB-A domain-containing protein 2-like n=1 Tax=Myzus persicae TaxID=13164 RepID=UPI000B9367CD|nr:KRAB-A domain-containing protein 2-like [Myzus persicae]
MEWQTRKSFNDMWKIIFATKRRGNKKSLSRGEYQDRIAIVRQLKEHLKTGRGTVSARNLRLLHKFNVIMKGGSEWLVKPSPLVDSDKLRLYVSNDELFDVLHEAHLETNHGTEDQMIHRIRLRYCNVTREAVSTYLAQCPYCRNPRGEDAVRAISPKAPMVVVPMPVQVSPVSAVQMCPSSQFSEYGSSVYFGFIDMRPWTRDGYSYIMVHWDIKSKFMHIMPLQSVHHVNVAVSLMDIYATFGMPHFIDAPYCVQYIKAIINHIKVVWRNEVFIKHRASDDVNDITSGWHNVQDLLKPWLTREKVKRNWPSEVKYIQFAINNQTFSGCSSSLYTRLPSDINPSV